MDTHQILLENFITNHPLAAANAIEKLNDKEVVEFIENHPIRISVSIISGMNRQKAVKCLELVELKLAAEILEQTDVRTAELLLRQFNEPFLTQILDGLPEKLSAGLRRRLSHPANTVGAFMTQIILGLPKETSVQKAIETGKREKEGFSSQIYIVDEQGKLEGVVKMKDLLIQEGSTKLGSIMISEIPKLYADAKIDSVLDHPGWYDFQDIPVIDSSERLIGFLNYGIVSKDIKKIAEERPNDIIETSNALGELYRIGITGFLQSLGK